LKNIFLLHGLVPLRFSTSSPTQHPSQTRETLVAMMVHRVGSGSGQWGVIPAQMSVRVRLTNRNEHDVAHRDKQGQKQQEDGNTYGFGFVQAHMHENSSHHREHQANRCDRGEPGQEASGFGDKESERPQDLQAADQADDWRGDVLGPVPSCTELCDWLGDFHKAGQCEAQGQHDLYDPKCKSHGFFSDLDDTYEPIYAEPVSGVVSRYLTS
jgi:hypothetical protein